MSGYHLAFSIAAVLLILAIGLAVVLLRRVPAIEYGAEAEEPVAVPEAA